MTSRKMRLPVLPDRPASRIALSIPTNGSTHSADDLPRHARVDRVAREHLATEPLERRGRPRLGRSRPAAAPWSARPACAGAASRSPRRAARSAGSASPARGRSSSSGGVRPEVVHDVVHQLRGRGTPGRVRPAPRSWTSSRRRIVQTSLAVHAAAVQVERLPLVLRARWSSPMIVGTSPTRRPRPPLLWFFACVVACARRSGGDHRAPRRLQRGRTLPRPASGP